MAKIYMMRQGNSLVPAEDSDHEAIQKLKHGTIYSNDVTAPRNIKRHRRFWALLDITFDYWQPQTMVAEVERETVNRLQNYFIKHGISEDATIALCQGFLVDLEQHRAEYQTGKDRESFRAWVTVQAGFYHIVQTPAGPRKVAKSISFANCDDVEFNEIYRQVLNVCWSLCLSRVFDNQEQLAESLLRFE